MRLSALAILFATFSGAAALSAVAAVFSVDMIEKSSIEEIERSLEEEGIDWAQVDANGLQVFLIGTAPSESARFKALSVAGKVVDDARVIDETQVAEADGLEAPRFSVEILRNGAEVQLIGLVPAEYDRAALVELVGRMVGGTEGVTDLLDSADYPTPEAWAPSMRLATLALDNLERSKISVEAGRLAVKAMASDAESRDRVARRLESAAPDGLDLELDLSAPRPVIAPFTLRFVADAEGARFDSCSADSETARERILEAARDAGFEGSPGCVIGLGVPAEGWGDAAAAAIAAVSELEGGSVTFTNSDIALVAVEGTDPARFDKTVGDLTSALPSGFVLDAVLPETPEEGTGPTEFVATQSPEGLVQLRGQVASETARTTVDSFARAAFGSEQVRTGLRVDDSLPEIWQARVLVALEALSQLANGSVSVSPDRFAITGDTGNKAAASEIAALVAEKIGDDQAAIEVTYQEKLDPTLGIPSPEECVARIGTITGVRKITFEPGSATLDASAKDVLDEIGELLRLCGDIPLEIQGHTDSQGREVMNQQLSQKRAESVLEALRKRRVLTGSYRARGYGEENPIADNGSEEGREANRRIEFHLIRAEGEETAENDTESVEDSAATLQEGNEAPEVAEQEPADEQD
ncbi:OmpA family protein [Roseivivax sp. CAU 1761]